MKNLDIRKTDDSINDVKLVKTEFDGIIIHGNDAANRLFGSYLSSNRVENKYDPNMKLMVLAKGSNKYKNDSIVNTLTEWFWEEESLDIDSIEYKKSLLSVFRNIRSFVQGDKESKTALGFVICNGYGDIVIYNVGSIKHYIKFNDDDYINDVTFLDPNASCFASLEDNKGSYYHYSGVDEVYLVQEEIPETDIEYASKYKLSASETVDMISSVGNYLYGKYGNVDRSINVLKIGKR